MSFFKCHQIKQHNSLFLFCSVLVGMVRNCWHPHIQWFPTSKFFYMWGKFTICGSIRTGSPWVACLEVVLIKTCWVLGRKWGWTQHASLSRLIAQKVINWTIFGNFGLQKDTLRVFCGCMNYGYCQIGSLEPWGRMTGTCNLPNFMFFWICLFSSSKQVSQPCWLTQICHAGYSYILPWLTFQNYPVM